MEEFHQLSSTLEVKEERIQGEIIKVENVKIEQNQQQNVNIIQQNSNYQNSDVKFNTKIVIVIDKEKFEICKRLILEDSPDSEIASVLQISESSVAIFKKKMMKFEDGIRERKRKLKELKSIKKKSRSKGDKKKSNRDVSVNERLNLARELVSKNYSTNQISKILQISERSVTRIKKKLREEKRRLKAEGLIPKDQDDDSDEESFRFLKAKEKLEKAKELFQQHLKISEISKILRISERSVRRWKDRLNRLASDTNGGEHSESRAKPSAAKRRSERNVSNENTAAAIKKEENLDDEDAAEDVDDEKDGDSPEESPDKQTNKRRRFNIDKETLSYAKQLVANNMKIKEMVGLLDLPFYTVRRLRTKILNNVPDSEIITVTDPQQFYMKKETAPDTHNESPQKSQDPLNVEYTEPVFDTVPVQYGYERKAKTVLKEREMILVKLLRDSSVRTMDIARIMNISERSVTRLLTRSKQMEDIEITQELIDEAERLKAQKDNPVILEEMEPGKNVQSSAKQLDSAKMQLAKNLLSMNVKVKDIAKMLEVSERSVTRWRLKFVKDGCLDPAIAVDVEDDENDMEVNPITDFVNTVLSSDSDSESSSSTSSSSSEDSSEDTSESEGDD